MRRRRKLLIVALILLGLPAVLMLIHVCRQEPFDAARWKAVGPNWREQRERWFMCDDLVDRHLRIGMTELEVETLLGPPNSRSEGYYEYDLGESGSLVPMCVSWLLISFENGVVDRFTVEEC